MRKPCMALAFAALMFTAGLNAAQTGRFLDSEGNVREKPDSKARLLFSSTAGEEFTVLERQGEKWLKIQLKDGRTGWTSIINVKLDAPAPPKEEKKSTTAWQARKEPLPSEDQKNEESVSASGSGSEPDLKAENTRLKDEVERLQQEKMMIESSTLQSQALIDKLKDDLRKMTAAKEKLETEIRQLKQQTGK